MAGSINLSLSQQFNKTTSELLSGGRLYFFEAGTLVPQNAYKESTLTVAHPNPIILASDGRVPQIYFADGAIRVRLTDKTGVVQFDQDSILVVGPSGGGGGGGSSVDPSSLFVTRDIKIRWDDVPLTGYVRCNGRTIGSSVSGASERANADCQALFEELWGYSNISIVGGRGATGAADWAANKQLTLPDCAGRLLGGIDNLGAGAQSRITSAVINNLGSGATGGEQNHTIVVGELPAHRHNLDVVTGNHHHAITVYSDTITAGSGGSAAIRSPTGGNTTDATVHVIGDTNYVGSDTPHNNMPPFFLFMIYIKL